METRLDDSEDLLAAFGAGLVLVSVALAGIRGWTVGAVTTITGSLGLAYLLTGVAVRECVDDPCRLRRALATVPVIGALAFVATVASDALAHGEVELTRTTVAEAGAVASLAFPSGLGYVVGAAESATGRWRALGVGVVSALLGGVLASYAIFYFGRTPFADLGVGVLIGCLLALFGALPAFVLATFD